MRLQLLLNVILNLHFRCKWGWSYTSMINTNVSIRSSFSSKMRGLKVTAMIPLSTLPLPCTRFNNGAICMAPMTLLETQNHLDHWLLIPIQLWQLCRYDFGQNYYGIVLIVILRTNRERMLHKTMPTSVLLVQLMHICMFSMKSKNKKKADKRNILGNKRKS